MAHHPFHEPQHQGILIKAVREDIVADTENEHRANKQEAETRKSLALGK
jgi:hypothetical protein